MAVLNDHEISIAGQPVLIEYQQQLADALGSWLPPCDLFVSRHTSPTTGESHRGLESRAFESSWPELPPLKIGQIQVPIGFSRYSRALFAVDKESMRQIAKEAFSDASDPIELDDFIENGSDAIDWDSKRVAVELKFVAEHEAIFDMFCLKPIRIATHSLDLWLLPLVDKRYDWQDYRSLITKKTWHEYFEDAMTELGISAEQGLPSTLQANGFGVPDRLCASGTTSLARILDAGGLSVGYRYVPGRGMISRSLSARHRNWRLDRDNGMLGGHSGDCLPVKKVFVVGRKSIELCGVYGLRVEPTGEYQEDMNVFHEFEASAGDGRNIEVMSLWWNDYHFEYDATSPRTEYDNAFAAYGDAWSQNWVDWDKPEYAITFAGVIESYTISSQKYLLCGHDDYVSIEVSDKNFVSKVFSLPHDFVPKFLVSQWSDSQVQEGPIYAKTPEAGIPAMTEIDTDVFEPGVAECDLFFFDIRVADPRIRAGVPETKIKIFNWSKEIVKGVVRATPTGGVFSCGVSPEASPQIYVAKTTSTITPRSGTTPGSGTVVVQTTTAPATPDELADVDPPEVLDVYSVSDSTIGINKYVIVARDDIDQRWWIIPPSTTITTRIKATIDSSGITSGQTFEDASLAEPITITNIEGIDEIWTGAATLNVFNPMKIKTWKTPQCDVFCHFNVTQNKWEIFAATSDQVLHGVKRENCKFGKLNGANGWTFWNGSAIGTLDAEWVKDVYQLDCDLYFDTDCHRNELVANIDFVREVKWDDKCKLEIAYDCKDNVEYSLDFVKDIDQSPGNPCTIFVEKSCGSDYPLTLNFVTSIEVVGSTLIYNKCDGPYWIANLGPCATPAACGKTTYRARYDSSHNLIWVETSTTCTSGCVKGPVPSDTPIAHDQKREVNCI